MKYVRSSSQRLDNFRMFVVLEQGRANVNVPLDVINRWNRTCLMLEVLLKYEATFQKMVDENCAFKSYFQEKDKAGNVRVAPSSDNDR